MITDLKCRKIKDTSWKDKIKACCDGDNPDEPKGCDCCYDTWKAELREVNTKYSEAEEVARLLTAELVFMAERRDRLKNWYDELTKANDLAQHICQQLEVMLSQTKKIATNTKYAIEAIKTLYCMIRDFYMQLDLLKVKYDQLLNCIKCLNDPLLAPGQGIMKCLEEYGKKLDALLLTRDELLKAVMAAVFMAYRINRNIALDYGLYLILSEWEKTLNCSEACTTSASAGSTSTTYSDQHHGDDNRKEGYSTGEDSCPPDQQEAITCVLEPMLQFPICNDPYYNSIREKYEKDKADATELSKKLIDLNKKKETLLACKQSLEAAILETEPKNRCQ